MIDTFPRPDVSAERYRELDILAMQIMVQLPSDIGECLIIQDIIGNHIRRWMTDERLPKHRDIDLSDETVVPIKKTAD